MQLDFEYTSKDKKNYYFQIVSIPKYYKKEFIVISNEHGTRSVNFEEIICTNLENYDGYIYGPYLKFEVSIDALKYIKKIIEKYNKLKVFM